MKRFSLLILLLIYSGISIQAQEKIISPSASNKSIEHILYVNVTNPLFFDKVGIAYSLRNARMDYFLFVNYRYSPGLLGTTIYFGADGVYGMARPSDLSSEMNGFDVGVQFRFRDPVLSKPYAKYLKNVEKASPFYAGLQVEFSYVNSRRVTKEYFNDVESWVVEPSVGPVVGWTLNSNKVFFNINMGLALGVSLIEYRLKLYHGFGSVIKTDKATAVIFKYDIGFLVGYKF